MSFIIAAAFAAVTALPALVPPEGESLPTASKMASARIFEWSDYGGEKSTAKARVTFEDARENCEAFRPGDTAANLDACAKAQSSDEVIEASANCYTGDLWANGEHYKFDGEYRDGFYANYIAVKDVKTGKQVPQDNASGGVYLGTTWRTLCPMARPYNELPYDVTYTEGPNESRIGEMMEHNDSLMFHHEDKGIIVYMEPKDSIKGTIKQNTVLFRGWVVPGEWIAGIAFTFKKGCAPAPYFVEGRLDNREGPQMTLKGKAPVRGEGCEITGYTDKGGNAKLVFQLPMH